MTAPSRRWFRFGLRTLFVVVTVFALLSAATPLAVVRYNEWQQQRQARKFQDLFDLIAKTVTKTTGWDEEFPESTAP